MPYVYLDLFVLVNGVVDYALLAATALATQARTSRWRLLLATAWGTAFACAVVLLPPGPWRSLPAVVLTSVVMLLLAFWPVSPRRLLALVAWFYGLACFVAGGALAVLSLLAGQEMPVPTPALALVPAVGAVLAAGRFFWQAWRRRSLPGPLYVTLRVVCEGRWIDLPALVDTGNQLRDPLTGLAVVVAEEQALAPLLPPALRQAVAAGDDIAQWARAATLCGWAERLRVVPFASIGRERGFLAGFRPDALWLQLPEGADRGRGEGIPAPAPAAPPVAAAPPEAPAGEARRAAAATADPAPATATAERASVDANASPLPAAAAADLAPAGVRGESPVAPDPASGDRWAAGGAVAPGQHRLGSSGPSPAEGGAGPTGDAGRATGPGGPAGAGSSPGSGRWRALGPAVVAVFPGRFTGDQHYVALLPTALLEAPSGARGAVAPGAAARVS
ncbi:MAG TPA: sigma-E processing peptidase SpoIIGA [Thermaerobacter sp.]